MVRHKRLSRGERCWWGGLIAVAATAVLQVGCAGLAMPGKRYEGPLPTLTDGQTQLRNALRQDVTHLAKDIGERNVAHPDALAAAADFVASRLNDLGYHVTRQPYVVDGVTCENIVGELAGRAHADEIVVVGAHYDTAAGSPGANDNASGVAGMLALAERLAASEPARTVRFVGFVNEEPPYFHTEFMGSLVYARQCREHEENIVAMLAFDGIGYYSDDADTQRYPHPILKLLYPSVGDFVAVIADEGARPLVRQVVKLFRERMDFASLGAALPMDLDGTGWSDHWSFRQQGYPAVLITDTLWFRYPHYHSPYDRPTELKYEDMARVVAGMEGVVRDLAK